LADIGFADGGAVVQGDFAKVVVDAADHDDGETLAGFDAGCDGALASGAAALGDSDDLGDSEADGGRGGDAFGDALEDVESASVQGVSAMRFSCMRQAIAIISGGCPRTSFMNRRSPTAWRCPRAA
jgi:hypothetical protein